MNYNPEQVLNGLINYADVEVMSKLPTTGKWVMGTAIGLATNKIQNIINTLTANNIVKMLGIIDENGNIDTDALIDAMKQSADKYGKISFDVPLIGRMTFSSADVDNLKNYIN